MDMTTNNTDNGTFYVHVFGTPLDNKEPLARIHFEASSEKYKSLAERIAGIGAYVDWNCGHTSAMVRDIYGVAYAQLSPFQ